MAVPRRITRVVGIVMTGDGDELNVSIAMQRSIQNLPEANVSDLPDDFKRALRTWVSGSLRGTDAGKKLALEEQLDDRYGQRGPE